MSSGLFKYRFTGVYKPQVIKIIKKTGLKTARHPDYKHIWYGFEEGADEAVFTWDEDEGVLRTDVALMRLERGIIK